MTIPWRNVDLDVNENRICTVNGVFDAGQRANTGCLPTPLTAFDVFRWRSSPGVGQRGLFQYNDIEPSLINLGVPEARSENPSASYDTLFVSAKLPSRPVETCPRACRLESGPRISF